MQQGEPVTWKAIVGLILTAVLVVGCSPHPSRTVVEEAIQWQISHPAGIRGELVGSQELGSQTQLLGVKVKRDQRWRGEATRETGGQSLTGRRLSGSYGIKLGRHQRTLPFSMVLVPDPPLWYLAVRQDSGWRLQSLTANGSAVMPEAAEEAEVMMESSRPG